MTDLTNLTIAEALNGLKSKNFSAVELTQAHVQTMEQLRDLNVYVAETPDIAMAAAKESDARYASGDAKILDGIPMGFKDLFCTKGVHSQACSNILKDFKPPYESTITANLRGDGAVMLGKLNMDEFAMGSTTELSCYGTSINPWKGPDGKDRTPGGSSGGSAAAVAARMCLGSLGSETGDSVRQPAAYCGVVGVRPTYGRCSRYGIISFASSLDQAGPMTRSVEDAALMMQSMSGHDPKDTTSVNVDVPDFSAGLGQDIKGMRVGIPSDYILDRTSPEVAAAWESARKMMEDAGATAVEISLPHTKYALPVYFILAPAEASSNLARYDGVKYGARVEGETLEDMYINTRTENFGDEVRARIMIGTYVLSAGYYDAYYRKAQRVRRLLAEDFKAAFEKVDVILGPTTCSPAFPVGAKTFGKNQGENDDPLGLYMEGVLVNPSTIAGLPGISLPTATSAEGLPIGMQLIAPAFDEVTMFKAAQVLEKQANFTAQPDLSSWQKAA